MEYIKFVCLLGVPIALCSWIIYEMNSVGKHLREFSEKKEKRKLAEYNKRVKGIYY